MKRIGLLGGSFNPAHVGHRRISLAAIDALGLDEVWWIVSPGNPLKARAKDNQALNSGALQEEDPGLHAAAVRHFGGYDKALKAAKVDPQADFSYDYEDLAFTRVGECP